MEDRAKAIYDFVIAHTELVNSGAMSVEIYEKEFENFFKKLYETP